MRRADLVCILVDASQLERSMYMVAEFAALNKPAVLGQTMTEVVRKAEALAFMCACTYKK